MSSKPFETNPPALYHIRETVYVIFLTESVSARVVLCEGVFVVESDDGFREEGAKGGVGLPKGARCGPGVVGPFWCE